MGDCWSREGKKTCLAQRAKIHRVKMNKENELKKYFTLSPGRVLR